MFRPRAFFLLCLLALSGVLGNLLGLSLPALGQPGQAVETQAPDVPSLNDARFGVGAPGTTHAYQHTLNNDTPAAIQFNLSVSSNKGFTSSVMPTTVQVGAGQSVPVTVTVTIPNDADPGTLDLTVLSATSVGPGLPLSIYDSTLVSTDTALNIPAAQYGTMANGTRTYQLSAGNITAEFWPGIQTQVLGYNGGYLAPTLVMTAGETVLVSVTNNLTEVTTTHWHGFHLPAEMDGGPHQPIEPGTTWTPTWTILNEASTLWFHPHPHDTSHDHKGAVDSTATTGMQVWRGLAGMAIVRDTPSSALGLPQTYGVDEFPLVLQDRQFLEDGQLDLELNNRSQHKGDTFLVNGTPAGHLDAPAQMVRFHVLNGSNFRFFYLGFSDDRPFYQIASDNALLNAPVQRTRLELAPGERVEIVVDLSDDEGETIHLVSFNDESFMTLTKPNNSDSYDHANIPILTLDVAQPTANAVTTLPTTLNDIARMDRSIATVEHVVTLNIPPSLNNTVFDMETINFTSTLDTYEVWSIINQSEEPHPIHIHGSPFQILTRNGVAPPAYELGWKDTVIVYPGEEVEVIKGIYDYIDDDSPFMYHCHLLEHEDKGMMGQYIVIVDGTSDTSFLPFIRK